MFQSFFLTWLEWVYPDHLSPAAPLCSVFYDSLVPLDKVHTYDCDLRLSSLTTIISSSSLSHVAHVRLSCTERGDFLLFTSHILSFPTSYNCFPRSLDLECAVCAQVCPNLWDPMDCSPPGSSVHGIFQARILEWVAISSSRGSSQSRDQTCISYIGRLFLYCWAIREAQYLECLLQFSLL